MMSSGDHHSNFDNLRTPAGPFPAAVRGLDHSAKFTEFSYPRFLPPNDQMAVEERRAAPLGRHEDSLRALGILKDFESKAMEDSFLLIPKLLSFIKQDDPLVVRQSVTAGTSLFCAVMTKMALQLRDSGQVEQWLEETWSWMLKFKDEVWRMLELGSTGSKVLAAKFLETCFLLFSTDGNSSEQGKQWNFSVSWLGQGHPKLNPAMLAYEASKILDLFFGILDSVHTFSGPLVITIINCLASIAKRRPAHYNSILSVLLDFDSTFETASGGHSASIRYAIRIALLGFVRCTHPPAAESREKVCEIVRLRYGGDATENTIRQMERLSRMDRDSRLDKDDPSPGQTLGPADFRMMRPSKDPDDSLSNFQEMPSKRPRLSATAQTVKAKSDLQDANEAICSFSLDTSSVNRDLTHAEKLIMAIGAFLAEGDQGAQSLEVLLSDVNAELLADIVIETMKHLPKSPSALFGRNGGRLQDPQTPLLVGSSHTGPPLSSAASVQTSASSSEVVAAVVGCAGASTSSADISLPSNVVNDCKRDPRRDPRRADPRRLVTPVGDSSKLLNAEPVSEMQYEPLHSSSGPTPSEALRVEDALVPLPSEIKVDLSESLNGPMTEEHTSEDILDNTNGTVEVDASGEGDVLCEEVDNSVNVADPELSSSLEISGSEGAVSDVHNLDQYSSSLSMSQSTEDVSQNLPALPVYVELANEQKKFLCKLAITRLIDDYKQIQTSGCGQSRLPLVARLLAQIDADDDLVMFFRKHIILDYHHNKGHDLAMHVLYHLHTVTISELHEHPSSASNNYEKFLLSIAKTLLDSLPASDKSFSRLFCETPLLPESAIKLLEDLCQLHFDENVKDVSDGDRITQGLGALWSLSLARPTYRQACLDIALKCSVHSHDEVRAKAIRLVANKLFPLPYASDTIEKFARSMLLSVVDEQVSEITETETTCMSASGQMAEAGIQEISVGSSHNSDLGPPESEPVKIDRLSSQGDPAKPLLHALQQTSLFFALCTKKPGLLCLVFDIYGRAPKAVKQSINRHMPGLIRTLGPSNPELLQIISDPPEGSENLIMLVLQLTTEDSIPPADLIGAVKHLYNTKLKDAAILIPMLSSFSKDEVLPIFPRLVNLPLQKFQEALARILQGSAHTGPALTPVEVFVAIHDVDPAKDKVALKKITDACTACFEQRTVFTQHVLERSLGHMVEQVPLPMLFMRTAIQAIGTFPVLVDFVMGLLSQLVQKQIWKIPQLWVGFLKLVSQTLPHSFNVLLQLPPPQLENALNRHKRLRGPLVAYVSQPKIRSSVARETLRILGLAEQGSISPA